MQRREYDTQATLAFEHDALKQRFTVSECYLNIEVIISMLKKCSIVKFIRFQGSYGHFNGSVYKSLNLFSVVGSIQAIDANIFRREPFECINPLHMQPCQNAGVSAVDFLSCHDPIFRTQNEYCKSAHKYFFAPDPENYLNYGQKQTPKLTTFIVVFDHWIDSVNKKVVIPNVMKHDVQEEPTTYKSVFEIRGNDDFKYYVPYKREHLSNMYNWTEYSYSMYVGPFSNFSDVCTLKDMLINHFVLGKEYYRPTVISTDVPDKGYMEPVTAGNGGNQNDSGSDSGAHFSPISTISPEDCELSNWSSVSSSTTSIVSV